MLHRQLAEAINAANAKGLGFIAREQLPGGGFTSYSSLKPGDFDGAKKYRTTFFPSLILSALAFHSGDTAEDIKKHAAIFLLAQKSSDWSFNYWDRASKEAAAKPYPDDLDDTFCALIALYKQEGKLLDGTVMASIAQVLITAETKTGGPYRTWLVPPDAPKQWQDIDLAVNANIARFLALEGVSLPNVVSLTETAIGSKSIKSPYYPNEYPICYFIAGWYKGDKAGDLISLLVSGQTSGHWPNPLQTALAVSSLLMLGYDTEKLHPAIRYLLRTQQASGSWPAAAFCIDPSQAGKTAYAGAPALTTALCLEAFRRFADAEKTLVAPKKSAPKQPVSTQYRRVKQQIRNVINLLPSEELRGSMRTVLSRLVRQDSDQQIVMLPWLVNQVLGSKVNEETLQQLATANLWGWMAYTVYDDFLDGEGKSEFLPAANVCLRNLVTSLRAILPDNKSFQAETSSIMDRIDAANAWEVAYCRGTVKNNHFKIKQLPDYGNYWQLADRSVGHTIAGLGGAYAAGLSGKQLAVLRTFFRHYLIARQLNDDMHDWEEDLLAGHVNAVAVEILRLQQVQKGKNYPLEIDLDKQSAALQRIFWEKAAPKLCRTILHHSAKARQALESVDGFDLGPLQSIIQKPELAAKEALDGRKDTLAFIKRLAVKL